MYRAFGIICCFRGLLERLPRSVKCTSPGEATASSGKYGSAISPHDSREFVLKFPTSEIRGRREDRVRAAPAVSCASCTKKGAHEHTGSAETLRPSPRNGFTAYSALSLVTGFLATIAREKRLLLTNLTPASGRQNHTTSPSASRAVRQKRIRVHRIPPHVRDDREPPLLSGETGELIALICPTS